MKVLTAYQHFIKAKRARGRRKPTISTYAQRLRPFLEKYGNEPLSTITPELIDDFIMSLKERQVQYAGHPSRPAVHKPLSPETIKNYSRVLKSFFTFCVARRYLPYSPAYDLETRVTMSRRVKEIEIDDLTLLLQETAKDTGVSGRRDYALMLFIRDTGARSGEAASVYRKDVDFEKRTAWVDGKNGEGSVQFTTETAHALTEWLKVAPPSEWLFCGLHVAMGQQMSNNSIYCVFRRRGKDLDIKRFNPHSFRHRVGGIWGQKHGLRLTQEKLRHKDINSTTRYVRIREETMRKLTDDTDIM